MTDKRDREAAIWTRLDEETKLAFKIACAQRKTTQQDLIKQLVLAWIADPDAMEKSVAKARKKESEIKKENTLECNQV